LAWLTGAVYFLLRFCVFPFIPCCTPSAHSFAALLHALHLSYFLLFLPDPPSVYLLSVALLQNVCSFPIHTHYFFFLSAFSLSLSLSRYVLLFFHSLSRYVSFCLCFCFCFCVPPVLSAVLNLLFPLLCSALFLPTRWCFHSLSECGRPLGWLAWRAAWPLAGRCPHVTSDELVNQCKD